MNILSKSTRIEKGRHSKLYYGFVDFGYELQVNAGKIFRFLFVMGFLIFCLYHYHDITNGINQISKDQQMREDVNMRIHNMVTTSTDCFVLQQNLLILVSDGANAESWIPTQYDSDLKIGKERSSILGCKP